MEAQPGAALQGAFRLAVLGFGAGGVGHGVGFVEDDDAVELVAAVFLQGAGEPFDDLVEARRLAVARG